MPFINVKTNVSVPEEKEAALKAALGQAVTILPGKSENWLMVGVEPDYHLWFKGTDEPAAMVDVSVFGNPNPPAYEKMTVTLCGIISEMLGVDKSRIYIKYSETPNWGWNGMNL